MKKTGLFLLSLMMTISSFAQLSDGSVAPNWTLNDINGTPHTLYDYLGQGKTVFLQFTATWSGPDYTYHSNGHLNALYNTKGPLGTNEAMVFMIEADASTDSADLYGGGGNTMGDFVTGTNYPIIDDASQNTPYNIAYYPTIYKVCPLDSTITEVGQIDSTALIEEVDNGCGPCSTFSGYADAFPDEGGCYGYAHSYPSGGVSPYSYYWYGSGNTGQSEYNLCAGTYYVRITDANNCVADSIPVVINFDPCYSYYVTTGPIYGASSSSNCDGTTEAWAGGNSPYLYQWSNGSTTEYRDSSLCAGNNWVEITNADGCVDTAFFVVDSVYDPCIGIDSYVYNIINTVDTSVCDGQAQAGVSYGVAPYTYEWSNNGTGNIESTLCFGDNWVVVTDANNCSDTTHFQVDSIFNACDFFYPWVDGENEIDNNCDGYALVVPDGGTAPFTYAWSNGATVDSIGSLCSGIYQVTVTDSRGCIDSATVEIQSDCSLDLSASIINNISCFGETDGMLNVIANGTAPYLYSLDSGETVLTTPIFDSLVAGTYVIMSQDSNECFGQMQFTIVEPPLLQFNGPLGVTDANCYGSNDGQITADVTGGTLPYNYQWSNGMVSDTLSSVPAGQYGLVLTDSSGCTITSNASINEPAAMNVSTSITAIPSCGVDNGTIQVDNVTGGTAPYSYNWTNGSNSNIADNLGAGIYVVTIEDNNGCLITETVNLTSASAPGIAVNTTSPLCHGGNDGAIDLVVTGGTAPITFDWSTGDQTEDVSGLIAGTYDVTIQDASGCVISEIITITDAPAIDLSNVTETLASCGLADGSLDVSVTGGAAPYTFLWSSGGNGNMEVNLAAGTYTLTVTDNNACNADQTYALSNDAAPVITIDQVIQPACEGGDGLIDVSVSGGTAPYTYLWSGGSTNEDLQSATVGNYQLTVTDQGGCQAVAYSELNGINLNAAEICLVTVDTATNGNIVVWTKDYGLGIAEYQIFKETAIFNQFQYLNTVPFDSLSQYVDLAANPDVHSYKYKVRTIDSCGNASDFLALHKTIFVNATLGASNEVNVTWDEYIGIDYDQYYILRNHPSTGWEVIDSVPDNVHSYTDINYPNLTGLEYSIEVIPNSTCTALRAQDHNSTRSNQASIAFPGGGGTGIDENSVGMIVYPNPNDGLFSVKLDQTLANAEVSIIDIRGRVLETKSMNGKLSETIDISDNASGIYFVELRAENIQKTIRIVKH